MNQIIYFNVILLVLIIITLLQSYKYLEHFDGQSDSKGDNQSDNNTLTNKPVGIIGPQGPIGPEGPQGPAGGIFTQQGPLRSVAKPNLVVDRMFGNTPQSAAYLTENNYKTHQFWTMLSDGSIQNKYGGCLFGDTNTNNVFMKTCKSGDSTLNWVYDSHGRLFVKNDPNKCLTVGHSDKLRGTSKITNNRKDQANTQHDVDKLELTTCDKKFPEKQLWTWY